MKNFDGVDARTMSDADLAELERQWTTPKPIDYGPLPCSTVNVNHMSAAEYALVDRVIRNPGISLTAYERQTLESIGKPSPALVDAFTQAILDRIDRTPRT